jgi:hypothetical protein
MNYRKLVSAALTATTILMVAGVGSLPLANAQSTSSIQAQIAALLAQIQQLQSQLGTSGMTTTTSVPAYNYTRDLTVGSTGADVTALQAFLIAQGDLTAVSAPTGYFGSLTQAALAKYQAANGITPSAGYFGPKTRAYLASLTTTTTTGSTGSTGTTSSLPAGCTSSTGYSSTTGVSCATGTTTSVVAPSTGLAISLASINPAAGSLISSASSGSARVPVLAVNFTAGNSGAVTLSGVSFQKTGVLSDSAISGAYLVQNGQVLAQYNSLNSGLLSFSGMDLSIPAGQTVTLTLAVDISGGLSAGNTTSFALPAASNVTAFDSNNNAVTPSGSFPLTGNVFTVTSVTNPSLATLQITSSSIATQVTAGTQGNIVGAWNFTVGNSPVYLDNINFHVIGSANVANLQNVKLLVNGTQVGQTLSSVPATGLADFDDSASPAKLQTGSNNVQVVADVMGSPSYYFQFEVLNGYDVLAVDSQYNVPISVQNTGGIGTQVQIQQGQITVNQDANTPTGNIARGQSGVVLAKFDIYAAGEPVKVQFLDFNIDLNGVVTSTNATTLASQIQNVSITDDAGNQVGTTINQPPSSNSCTPATTAPGAGGYLVSGGTATIDSSNVVYTDCFGTSASPINYIVPANTTRVLSIKADIQSTADFSSITANLSGDTNNLQGMISSQTGSTSGVNGVSLTMVTSSLTASQNNALGTQNVSAGTSGIQVGSYAFSASSAEGVNVNTVSVQLEPGTSTNAFQNLRLLVNGTQFGSTQGVVTNGATYSFSGPAFNVPAGQTVDVNVYADSLSSAAGTYAPATALVGYTGVGQVSYTSVNIPAGQVGSCGIQTGVCGQTVSFNGQPALTIAADSSNPPAGQIVQNATGNTLAVFRFTETSNVESVKVTQLNVVDTVASSGVKAAFSNVGLWNGSTLLGTAQSPILDASNTGYLYAFTGLTNLIVPQGNSVSLTLKGDAGSVTNGSLTDNTTQTFTIATTTDASNSTTSLTVVARGATSNKTAVVTLSNASGNPQTTLRTLVTVAANPVTGAPPNGVQQIGSITFTANSAGDAVLNNLKLTFNSTNTAFLGSVALKDPSGNDIYLVDGFATSTVATSTATSTVNWAFATSSKDLVVTAGSSYTLTLWGNLADIPAVSNQGLSLTATINGAQDFGYLDSSSPSASPLPQLIYLQTNQVPITVSNLTSGSGLPL